MATRKTAEDQAEQAVTEAEEVVAEKPRVNLAAKLAYITGQMAHVKKAGFNKAQQYAFVRETDVAERLSVLLAQENIFLHQTVVAHSMTQLYVTGSGSQMWLSEVEMEFQFIDGDTGEITPKAMFPGHGADTGDKGIYKAMTGAEKYMIMKTFLVSTGDDPEADEKVDKAAATAGATRGPLKINKGTQEGVERGGKASVITSAQVKEIVRLIGELKIDAATFGGIVSKTTGVSVDDKTGKEILAQLTPEQAGGLITALSGMAIFAEDVVDSPVDTVENTVQEDLKEAFTVV